MAIKTNERIKNALVRFTDKYTEAQYDNFEKEFDGMSPANTVERWRKLGYYLNKDEEGNYVKQTAYTKIWKKESDLTDKEKEHILRTLKSDDGTVLAEIWASIFTIEQVHPANKGFTKTHNKMIEFFNLKKSNKKSAK